MSTANHLVEAERILQRMIEKNPVLQKLIDDLDLVLVGASPIGNDDENLLTEESGSRRLEFADNGLPLI